MNDPSVELSFDGAPDGMDDYVVDAPLPSSVSPPVKVPPAIAEEDETTEPEADSVAEEPPEAPPEETFVPRGTLAATATAKKKKKPFFTFPSDGYGRRHSAPSGGYGRRDSGKSPPAISEEDEATEPTEAAEKNAQTRTKPFWRVR